MDRPIGTDLLNDSTLSRRTLLRTSTLGLAGVAIGLHPRAARALGAVGTTTVSAAEEALELTMRPCLVEMVDRTRVPMWAFDNPEAGLRAPGPVTYATDGAPITIHVTNELTRPHAFAVPGVVDSGPIAPGETRRVTFDAPAAGTYVYLDPLNAPINRAMGLAGAFVVLPRDPDSTTPYTEPTQEVQNLFDDLGTTAFFPGSPWQPERSWVWIFASVDPGSTPVSSTIPTCRSRRSTPTTSRATSPSTAAAASSPPTTRRRCSPAVSASRP